LTLTRRLLWPTELLGRGWARQCRPGLVAEAQEGSCLRLYGRCSGRSYVSVMTLPVSTPRMNVGRLIVRPAVVADPSVTLREAARVMATENVSSLLVGGPSAIVTERDFTAAWMDGLAGDEPVGRIVGEAPMAIDASMAITEAAGLMLNHSIRHVVVFDAGSFVGVVSLRAILAVLLQAAEP